MKSSAVVLRSRARVVAAIVGLAAAGCVSTPPLQMPRYDVDATVLREGPPLPHATAAAGTVGSAIVADSVTIAPERATGYANLPTTVTQLFDGPVRPIGLQDVVVQTLANDRRIRVQGYALRIAEWDIPVSKAIYDLVVSASASYTRVEDQAGVAASGPVPINSSRTRAFSAALSQLFPSGALLNLAYQTARNASGGSMIDVLYPHRVTLRATQPLLKGFGPRVVNAGIRIAQLERQGAAADFQTLIENRLVAALLTYWDLIGAIEQYKVQVISFSAALDLLRVNRAKFAEGVVPSTEVLQAEAAVETRRNLVIRARQTVRDLEDELKRQLFLQPDSPDWPVQLQPTQPIAWRPVEVDLPRAIERALAQRPELRRSASNLGQARERLTVAENDLLPELNLFGSIGSHGLGTGFDEGFRNLESGKYVGYSAGIEVVYPLQNRAARYRLRQAQARVSQAEELQRDQVDQITLEVRQAARALETARRQIEATQAAVRSEEAKLEAEMRRNEVGLSTAFQVLLFQEDLAQAQSSHIAAVVGYNQALVRLERAQGSLLASYGVSVADAELTPESTPVGFPIRP